MSSDVFQSSNCSARVYVTCWPVPPASGAVTIANVNSNFLPETLGAAMCEPRVNEM